MTPGRNAHMAALNVSLYDPRLVQPMREELTRIGFQELRTAAEVDAALAQQDAPTLVVVNSVCGCAARNARPAATLAIQHPKRPARAGCGRCCRNGPPRRGRGPAATSPDTRRRPRRSPC